MTIRGRHRLAASVLLAATVAVPGSACGGGGGREANSAARPRAPGTRDERDEIAARSSFTTTTRPRPLPQPDVIDHGYDVVAIARSLLLFGRWLEWHHPDPALVARAYQPGSPPERVTSSHVATLRRIGAHIVEVDSQPFDLSIISIDENVASFRLTEYLAHRELIAADGHVVERDARRTEHYVISIMRSDSSSPWRLNYVQREGPKIEVQL